MCYTLVQSTCHELDGLDVERVSSIWLVSKGFLKHRLSPGRRPGGVVARPAAAAPPTHATADGRGPLGPLGVCDRRRLLVDQLSESALPWTTSAQEAQDNKGKAALSR
jgi:hypothetical protein